MTGLRRKIRTKRSPLFPLKKKQLQRIEDGAALMLEEFMEAVVARHPELQGLAGLRTLLVKGLPSARILEVSDQERASIIVLGSKGITGLKHLMVGSVAERVVHMASVPVTVVKAAK